MWGFEDICCIQVYCCQPALFQSSVAFECWSRREQSKREDYVK